jgi:hypothetical protein
MADLVEIENMLVSGGAQALRDMGFRVFELRKHGDTLRIALGSREFGLILSSAETAREVVARLKPFGYRYVALDLEPIEDTWHSK